MNKPSLLKGKPWTADFPFPGRNNLAVIDARSYNAWIRQQLPFIEDEQIIAVDRPSTIIKEGKRIGDDVLFSVSRLPQYEMYQPKLEGWPLGRPYERQLQLALYSCNAESAAAFEGRPIVPALYIKRRNESWDVWMSMTPMEIMTQRPLIKRACGNVLIGGLGLGYMTRQVLQRKKVTKVTVVEKNQDILEYFGAPLRKEFGDRLELKHADVYEEDWTSFDVALWDIWKNIADAPWDDKFQQIKNKMQNAGKVCVGWTDWANRCY